MKRMAMIQDGVVFNIAVWDGISTWDPGVPVVDVTDMPQVDIGYLYDGQNFTAAPQIEPED